MTPTSWVWRNSLVALTGTNRLINFKPRKTGLVQIASPAGRDILRGLRPGSSWTFQGLPDQESDPESSEKQPVSMPKVRTLPTAGTLQVARRDNELGPVLRGLLRRANQE